MSRGPRWQIWVPRLLLVGIVALAAQYGLGLAVRSAAIRSSESALETAMEVGATRVSLLDRQVVLNDLRLANPNRPDECLLEADRCELDFAAGPLLHKQAVATRGRVSGLRFSAFAGGDVKAASRHQTEPPVNWFGDESDAVASQWFANLSERFKHNLVDQFESVQRTEAFCANWSGRSAALEARGQQLNHRVAELQKSVEAADANPLRNDKLLADLPQTIADLEQDFSGFISDLERLPDLLETERRAIVAARRHDYELVRKRVTLEPIDADALSVYLLRTQAAAPLNDLVGWLRWLRKPAGSAGCTADRARGEDLPFAGCRRTPNLLIQGLELRGSARVASQPVELRGSLTGLSTAPALLDEPIRLRMVATGSMPLELQATIDRTRGAKRDAVLLDCRGIVLPRLELGQSDQLAVTIDPSVGSLSVSLAVDADKLTGDVQMVQRNVRITPTLAGEFADVPVGDVLEETLGQIDSLATRLSLGGTLTEPTCTLWSNLGPAVAEAMQRALERASGQHSRAMLVEAGQQVDERLTGVERQMSEQQARWSARTADVRAQLQSVVASKVPRDRLSPDRLGSRLPSNSLFR